MKHKKYENKTIAKVSVENEVIGNFLFPANATNEIANHPRHHIIHDYILKMLRKCIRPHTAVIDAGANFGVVSCLIANYLNNIGGGKIIAFEANPIVSYFLKQNLEKNITKKYDNVEVVVYDSPLLDEERDIKFPMPPPEHCDYGLFGIDNLFAAENAGFWTLSAVTIDSKNIECEISAFKIDVQGHDHEVVVGAKETIKRNDCGIVFEYEPWAKQKYTLQDTLDFLRSINPDYRLNTRTKCDYLFTSGK